MTRPWWDDDLTADERHALDPGSSDVDPRPDVLVVGGGAVGLAAAVMCRRAGLGRVQVIERDLLASGPSGSAAGGLSPGMHEIGRPPEFAALAAESLALHRALDEEWGGAIGLRDMDWLVVSSERIPAGSIDVPGLEAVDPAHARELEPALGDVAGAITVRAQSWVHPQRLVIALASRAGGVATGVAMLGFDTSAGRVVRVRTTAGDVAPGAVVLATGSAPPELGVPQTIVKGHLLVTAPVPEPPRVGIASSIIVIPLEGGRLLAGGTFDHGDADAVVRERVVAQILAETSRMVPAADGIAVERAWCCFRPGTPDELPVIDRVPGIENAWMSVGHYRTGLLLAPGAGAAIASWIGGEKPDRIDAFSAVRFG